MLSLRPLLRPLVDLLACEHVLISCPTCDCSLVYASACNCKSTCDLVCECVPTCIRGYKFPPASKHVLAYKNPPENAITPKLFNT